MADARSFRKKPVVVQAIQWDGTLSGIDDILSVFSDIRTVAKTAHPSTNKCSFWKIGTLEGSHEVSAGDFIIRGVKGEYYPCKPDIFAMTYEPADATPPADAALIGKLRHQLAQVTEECAALRARAVPEELPLFDAAIAVELPCVSVVPYNSKEICTWFAKNVRERMLAASKAGDGKGGE